MNLFWLDMSLAGPTWVQLLDFFSFTISLLFMLLRADLISTQYVILVHITILIY